MKQNSKNIHVGIGEVKVSSNPEAVMSVYGVGSCICVCAYDGSKGIGGMAHILLPGESKAMKKGSHMYADDAIRRLFAMMEKRGADPGGIDVMLAGGSNVLESAKGKFMIGDRNAEEVLRILKEMNVKISKKDIGGRHSRTVHFNVSDGSMTVESRSKKQ